MSSQSDEYQVLLPSNVKGNPTKQTKPIWDGTFKRLDLPGEWDVALNDILYPHNWINLDKYYQYCLFELPNVGVNSEFSLEHDRYSASRYILIHPKSCEFLKPVAMKGAQTLLKAGSVAITESATLKTHNQVYAQTYGRRGFKGHGRPGRHHANWNAG